MASATFQVKAMNTWPADMQPPGSLCVDSGNGLTGGVTTGPIAVIVPMSNGSRLRVDLDDSQQFTVTDHLAIARCKIDTRYTLVSETP